MLLQLLPDGFAFIFPFSLVSAGTRVGSMELGISLCSPAEKEYLQVGCYRGGNQENNLHSSAEA